MRTWHKGIPPKKVHEQFGMYNGVWSKQLDRYWESDDGYTVSSRLIRTDWGTMEHVTIGRIGPIKGDIPWAVKQEIKNELFGIRAVAIEVFPAQKNLVDVVDLYHLWILPKDMKLPFGIHPARDPMGEVVERGYDFDLEECRKWTESPQRAALMEGKTDDESDVKIDKLSIFKNEVCPNGGMRLEWSGDAGFGQYDLTLAEDGKLHGDSEHMDSPEDKSFLVALLNDLISNVEIDN